MAFFSVNLKVKYFTLSLKPLSHCAFFAVPNQNYLWQICMLWHYMSKRLPAKSI